MTHEVRKGMYSTDAPLPTATHPSPPVICNACFRGAHNACGRAGCGCGCHEPVRTEMRRHAWRQPPLHDVVGQPNDAIPSVAFLCGHVDAGQVCLLDEPQHSQSVQERLSVAVGKSRDQLWMERDRAVVRCLELEKVVDAALLVSLTEAAPNGEWPAMDDLKAALAAVRIGKPPHA